MKVKVINKSKNDLPAYATLMAAGLDLRANLDRRSITIYPGERTLVGTGLYMEIPEGYELQIRPRSGYAYKFGLIVPNSPGTIDADYRGEICVMLGNISDKPITINSGDRIAQGVLSKFEKIEFEEVTELGETERGIGGFGHSGTK